MFFLLHEFVLLFFVSNKNKNTALFFNVIVLGFFPKMAFSLSRYSGPRCRWRLWDELRNYGVLVLCIVRSISQKSIVYSMVKLIL
jgi:hypothetical protein